MTDQTTQETTTQPTPTVEGSGRTEGIHVGEFVRDEMEARGWDADELARRMCERPEDFAVHRLCLDIMFEVRDPIVRLGETADALARAFGTSPTIWTKLDESWRVAQSLPTPPASRGTGVPTMEEIEELVAEAFRANYQQGYAGTEAAPRAIAAERAMFDALRTLLSAAEQTGNAGYVRALRSHLDAALDALAERDPIAAAMFRAGTPTPEQHVDPAAEQGERALADAERLVESGLLLRETGEDGTSEWWVNYPGSRTTARAVGPFTFADAIVHFAARQPRQEGDR